MTKEDFPEEHQALILTTHQAADKVGRSAAWVKQHATDLGGRLINGAYRFPAEITIDRVKERITLKTRLASPSVIKEQVEGENAAKVFELLDQGISTREIIKQLRLPPRVVAAFAEAWIEAGKFDDKELAIIHGRRDPDPSTVESSTNPPSTPQGIEFIAPTLPIDEVPERAPRRSKDAIIAEALAELKKDRE